MRPEEAFLSAVLFISLVTVASTRSVVYGQHPRSLDFSDDTVGIYARDDDTLPQYRARRWNDDGPRARDANVDPRYNTDVEVRTAEAYSQYHAILDARRMKAYAAYSNDLIYRAAGSGSAPNTNPQTGGLQTCHASSTVACPVAACKECAAIAPASPTPLVQQIYANPSPTNFAQCPACKRWYSWIGTQWQVSESGKPTGATDIQWHQGSSVAAVVPKNLRSRAAYADVDFQLHAELENRQVEAYSPSLSRMTARSTDTEAARSAKRSSVQAFISVPTVRQSV
ncbi:hypothetical protein MMC19_004144 [Ptychographa xylographoides]|nr:hypothetical protein [Ptychographa xylographoides]